MRLGSKELCQGWVAGSCPHAAAGEHREAVVGNVTVAAGEVVAARLDHGPAPDLSWLVVSHSPEMLLPLLPGISTPLPWQVQGCSLPCAHHLLLLTCAKHETR